MGNAATQSQQAGQPQWMLDDWHDPPHGGNPPATQEVPQPPQQLAKRVGAAPQHGLPLPAKAARERLPTQHWVW